MGAGLRALEGAITDRTALLIEHHMDAQAYHEGTLGARARTRLQNSEDFDDLMLLRDFDRKGRVAGATVGELRKALESIKALERSLDA